MQSSSNGSNSTSLLNFFTLDRGRLDLVSVSEVGRIILERVKSIKVALTVEFEEEEEEELVIESSVLFCFRDCVNCIEAN
jgi:hypothetical protein